MNKASRDLRRVRLGDGDDLAVEHVSGFVTSIWPGRDNTSWIEVRQRDGRDRLCHALVALPLEERQVDEVSFVLGGRDKATVLAWTLWRHGTSGALADLRPAASSTAAPRMLDPGLLGALAFKAFHWLPTRLAAAHAELSVQLRTLLAARHGKVATAP